MDSHLEYRLLRNGKTSVASRDWVDPFVTGPSLHGFVLQQRSALAAGKVVPVRMVVMTKMETCGFDVRTGAQAHGRTSFSVTPGNWLIRRVVAPLTVTQDTGTKNLVRYEGRVPPPQLIDGKLNDLDARVECVMHVAACRRARTPDRQLVAALRQRDLRLGGRLGVGNRSSGPRQAVVGLAHDTGPSTAPSLRPELPWPATRL